MTPILLDTCAAIWLADESKLSSEALVALGEAYSSSTTVYVSPMTAWEMGMLISKGRYRTPLSATSLFDRVIETDGMALAPLLPRVLIASSYLPGQPPRDPTDRIILATAREYGYRVMTRDRPMLDYAEQGHVQALVC